MLNFRKIFWTIRYSVLFVLYKNSKLPGYLGRPSFVSSFKDLSFGKYVRIYPGMRAETLECGKIIVGNNVSIGQNFHVVSCKNDLNIGNNVVISGNVMITNCDHEYRLIDSFLYDQPLIVKDTLIGDNCFIGYGAVILAGTILGKQCIVGANSVVRGEFPDYCVIVGNPGKVVKKYNQLDDKWEKIT